MPTYFLMPLHKPGHALALRQWYISGSPILCTPQMFTGAGGSPAQKRDVTLLDKSLAGTEFGTSTFDGMSFGLS